MRTLKYFLADAAKNKAIVHQLYFIGVFLQEKVKNRVFVKLDIRYTYYFPEDAKYFVRALRLLKSMYGMTNSIIFHWSVLASKSEEQSICKVGVLLLVIY